MASNKQLNKTDREVLIGFAASSIQCPQEEAARDESYQRAKPYVLAAVRQKYPPSDMKVMERYGAARVDTCIRFGGSYDNESVFRFREDDRDAPLVPRHTGCSDRSYDWSDKVRAVLIAHVTAVRNFEKARELKLEDYRRLVIGSRTFNDVVAVWPAAEALRNKLIPQTAQQRALAVLSEEAVARIKADNAGAMAVAA